MFTVRRTRGNWSAKRIVERWEPACPPHPTTQPRPTNRGDPNLTYRTKMRVGRSRKAGKHGKTKRREGDVFHGTITHFRPLFTAFRCTRIYTVCLWRMRVPTTFVPYHLLVCFLSWFRMNRENEGSRISLRNVDKKGRSRGKYDSRGLVYCDTRHEKLDFLLIRFWGLFHKLHFDFNLFFIIWLNLIILTINLTLTAIKFFFFNEPLPKKIQDQAKSIQGIDPPVQIQRKTLRIFYHAFHPQESAAEISDTQRAFLCS